MSAVSHGGIARALQELEIERSNLAARMEKLDTLMAAMRDVFHLPSTPGLKGRRRQSEPRTTATSRPSDLTDETILAALRKGPVKLGELAAAVGAERATLRARLRLLEERGLVVSTGVTASRRVALARHEAARAAKEAP